MASSSVSEPAVRRPIIREHVLYCERDKDPVDALVAVVFSERGLPRVTVVIIRIGGGDTVHRCCIPHRDHVGHEKAWWCFPGE